MFGHRLIPSFFLLLIASVSYGSDGTDLGALAESMQPGTWAELQTNGLDVMAAPSSDGSSGHILPYAIEFMWDPRTKKAFFVGGDHNGGPEKFVEYNATSNTWRENPRPFWMSGSENQNHSYSYMAVDSSGDFWYQGKEYNTSTGTWVDHGEDGQHFSSATRGRKAYAYLAGVGNVVYFEGAVYILDENGSGAWRQVRPRWSLGDNRENLHFVAVQNPITNTVLMGAGDSSDRLWLMDSAENIRPLGPTPLTQISCKGDDSSIITVDPGTGFFIIHAPTGELWEFDADNDRWTLISENTPLSDPKFQGWQNNIIGATSTTHNVSIYVRWDGGSGSKMWLYKHSVMPPSTSKRSEPPTDLRAN